MYTIIIIKTFCFFPLQNIEMNRSSINFNNEKINKSDFFKNKKIFHIDNIDANKILVSKNKHMVNIIHLILYWV